MIRALAILSLLPILLAHATCFAQEPQLTDEPAMTTLEEICPSIDLGDVTLTTQDVRRIALLHTLRERFGTPIPHPYGSRGACMLLQDAIHEMVESRDALTAYLVNHSIEILLLRSRKLNSLLTVYHKASSMMPHLRASHEGQLFCDDQGAVKYADVVIEMVEVQTAYEKLEAEYGRFVRIVPCWNLITKRFDAMHEARGYWADDPDSSVDLGLMGIALRSPRPGCL